FDYKRAHLSDLDSLAYHRFSTNSHIDAKPERAPRKIQHAASLYLPAGNVATNGFAVWELHQLSGQCRCARQQHRGRRRERTVDCRGSERWQQDYNRLEAV